MTNAKIEKIRSDIAKTKGKVAEYNAKLREQEKALKQATDEAVLAMFRDENVSDEQLRAVRRLGFGEDEAKPAAAVVSETRKPDKEPENKEVSRYATQTDE
jgi:Holliday junction resolvasome RuvABC DNA-binding subunit